MEKDSNFQFNFCPDCGSADIKPGGLFSGMGMVMSGKNGRCQSCGKEWHVIREDDED